MITREQIKNDPRYEFEIAIDESILEEGDTDIWGMGYVWFADAGVEYNYCMDSGDNCCAIYKMEYNKETDYWDTDYNTYIHFEIPFKKKNWEKLFVNAMIDALVSFYGDELLNRKEIEIEVQ